MAGYTKQIFELLGVEPRERFKLKELPSFTYFIGQDLTIYESYDEVNTICRLYGDRMLLDILKGVFHIVKQGSKAKMDGDTKHVIVDDIYLKGNAKLHRFENAAGTQYSAIYTADGEEAYSCERNRENGMIAYWNNSIWF